MYLKSLSNNVLLLKLLLVSPGFRQLVEFLGLESKQASLTCLGPCYGCWLGFSLHVVPGCSKRQKMEFTIPLKAESHRLHTVISSAFSWSKQIVRLGQNQELEK